MRLRDPHLFSGGLPLLAGGGDRPGFGSAEPADFCPRTRSRPAEIAEHGWRGRDQSDQEDCDAAIKTLDTIAKKAVDPAVRRAALYAMCDLYLKQEKAEEAMEVLGRIAIASAPAPVPIRLQTPWPPDMFPPIEPSSKLPPDMTGPFDPLPEELGRLSDWLYSAGDRYGTRANPTPNGRSVSLKGGMKLTRTLDGALFVTGDRDGRMEWILGNGSTLSVLHSGGKADIAFIGELNADGLNELIVLGNGKAYLDATQ